MFEIVVLHEIQLLKKNFSIFYFFLFTATSIFPKTTGKPQFNYNSWNNTFSTSIYKYTIKLFSLLYVCGEHKSSWFNQEPIALKYIYYSIYSSCCSANLPHFSSFFNHFKKIELKKIISFWLDQELFSFPWSS